MLRPEQIKEQIKWIDEQLKRLDGLNVPPEQKKAIRERLERLKSQPVPNGPIRLRKLRDFRIDFQIPRATVRIPPSPPVLTMKQRVWRGEKYIPPVLSPEEQREKREMTYWHAQKGLYFSRLALEHANSNERREHILRTIQILEQMLERNKEK